MSTDFQAGRVALGARLRELRTEAGLSGKGMAALLGWQPSKVSRLEHGKQTATAEDLEAWACGAGAPAEAEDLKARLRGLESQQRSWRRQLASGHRGVQERYVVEYRNTSTVRGYEATVIPGLFQTPDYARHLLVHNADFMRTPRDTEEAVRARMQRQEVLYQAGRTFHVMVWEGALHALICPRDVMSAQLDRLMGLIGMDRVNFGVIPLGAPLRLTPKHGFWIFDDARVIIETINTELHFESSDDVTLYRRAWDRLNEAAVYGPQAHRLIVRARAALSSR
ncbi:helix-turn-helix domain-containing protein [Streptoverticillium reticulum]|uniref:helix-turn-helix domain-containing protein n=1 Tax=Streptoverticillium reticulum TaxID=1433415 RepID=UPI0039BF9CE8